MDKIAFVYGEVFLYWNSIILTLAAAAAICLFLAFYLERGGSAAAAAAVVPVAMVFSLVLARFVHWYCRADSYAGLKAAMTDYTSGGYALLGVFAGCLLTAGLFWAVRLEKHPLRMLDSMCMAGVAGIGLGRLACFYSASDRGQILQELRSLPWAYPVVNQVSGAVEYRLATFLLQAIAMAVVFVILLCFYVGCRRSYGHTTVLFLLLYGATQAVLDSTRYDSLFMRSNGFISFDQLLGAVGMVVAAAIFCVALARKRGFRKWQVGLWVAFAALMGGAGYMEYYVQRHGDLAVFSYSVMSTCLFIFTVLGLVVYCLGMGSRKRPD